MQYKKGNRIRMALSGQRRREQIQKILEQSKEPIAGADLAKMFSVSRQVVVQDIALIRANGLEITATNRGYILQETRNVSRVFKVIHTEEQVEEELNLYVDLGAKVENVFVFHKVYGVIKADINIRSRKDVQKYMEEISSGKSTNLMKLTSNYHYHKIVAEDENTLDLVQKELELKGFLAELQEYEPIDFAESNIKSGVHLTLDS